MKGLRAGAKGKRPYRKQSEAKQPTFKYASASRAELEQHLKRIEEQEKRAKANAKRNGMRYDDEEYFTFGRF